QRARGSTCPNSRQATMLSVLVEEQLIVDLKRVDGRGALSAKSEHRIGTIRVAYYLTSTGMDGTDSGTRLHTQPRKRVSLYVGPSAFQPSPADDAAAVAVQSERVVEVSQGDVPSANQFAAIHADGDVAVARFVGMGRQTRKKTPGERNLRQEL